MPNSYFTPKSSDNFIAQNRFWGKNVRFTNKFACVTKACWAHWGKREQMFARLVIFVRKRECIVQKVWSPLENKHEISVVASYSVGIYICTVWASKVLDLVKHPADSGPFLRIGHHSGAEKGLKTLRITVSKIETRLYSIHKDHVSLASSISPAKICYH